jgi:dihydroorotate dehydrogenase
MSWVYRRVIRPALFANDAEWIHGQTMHFLNFVSRHEFLCDAFESFFSAPQLSTNVFGLQFPNPVGLAAGMDKKAEAVPAWEAMGFGFSELGGVTWHEQPGNPQPRIFRAVPDEAIVNRMGFNNPGAVTLAQKLAEWRAENRWPQHPVGINLGKSKVTPLEQATEDYVNSFRALHSQADFFVVNVSSPNTPNLRQLQDKAALSEILMALNEANRKAPKPILVKVAPDLSFEALDDVAEVAKQNALAGIVATNTTVTRPETNAVSSLKAYAETGGLSGRPLRVRSTEVVRHLYRQTRGTLPIIGAGGIFDAVDAWEKITNGASLVQVYTGLVYEGPWLARSIVTGLRQIMEREGFKTLRTAVGSSQ